MLDLREDKCYNKCVQKILAFSSEKVFFFGLIDVDFIIDVWLNGVNRVLHNVLKRGITGVNTGDKGVMSMRKEYTIKELQAILGCSRTAIVKKIKTDENNTGVKRYKSRYEVVTKNGQIAILLSDDELEHERTLSRGMGEVLNEGVNTHENENIIDIEPERRENETDKILDFTKRYIADFETLHKTFYQELRERDKQILLLTTSENSKQEEYLRTKAENVTLKKRNTVLMIALGVIIVVLVSVITLCVTLNMLHTTNKDTVSQPEATVAVPPAVLAPQPVAVTPVKHSRK